MGVIFNEDPNHFVYTRAQAGVTELYRRLFKNKHNGFSDMRKCKSSALQDEKDRVRM